MVKSAGDQLDLVFQALSDPTRRAILEALVRADLAVGEVAAPHDLSPAAISKHLKVLERAGLVGRIRDGRRQRIQLRADGLARATQWLSFADASLSRRLEDLADLVEGGRRAPGPGARKDARR